MCITKRKGSEEVLVSGAIGSEKKGIARPLPCTVLEDPGRRDYQAETYHPKHCLGGRGPEVMSPAGSGFWFIPCEHGIITYQMRMGKLVL